MMRSLYSAVSGIGVNQKSMDVIGNNIANVNTIGFKTGRAVFQDMISQTLAAGRGPSDARGGINPKQIGTGASLAGVDNIFTQGTIKTTIRPHDLALEGDGFFVVRGGTSTKQFFTRAGDFNFDKQGFLSTPSGYRVQGWMTDPTTGMLEYNTVARDIFVSDSHKTIQANATSKIEYGGVLNTVAKPSIYEFKELRTQASDIQDIFTTYAKDGNKLDLTSSDSVRVRANATGNTNMTQTYNKNGESLNLINNNTTVNIRVNGNTHNMTLVNNASGSTTEFTTLQDFADVVKGILVTYDATADVKIVEGKLEITSATGGTGFEIEAINTASAFFSTILDDLQGTYSGQTKKSKEFFFQKDIDASQDFENLGELATQIENIINGNVISSDFSAQYLDNNFGLKPGDTVKISLLEDSGGAALTKDITLTYSTSANPDITQGEFNTVYEYAEALRYLAGSVNHPAAGSPSINLGVNVTGNSFDISYGGTSDFKITGVETGRPSAGTTNVSPYLEGVFAPLLNYELDSVNTKSMNVKDISGRGRIAYTNLNGTELLTGFSITKSTKGDIFNDNILSNQNGRIESGNGLVSEQFLTTATEDTLILDLYTLTGKHCGFNENASSVKFNSKVGGEKPAGDGSFLVGVESTVGNMMEQLEIYLGLGDDHNTKQNVTIDKGKITVIGEQGKGNEIDSLMILAEPASRYVAFNDDFGQPARRQSAEGGQVSSNMSVYDEQGNEHIVQFQYALHNGEKNEWTIKISTDEPFSSVRFNGATTNELVIRFNSDGTPSYLYDPHSSPIKVINNPTIDFDAANGTNVVSNIDLDLGTPGKYDGLYLSAQAFDINKAHQDGYPMGALEDKLFSAAGEIVGVYTNGIVRNIGQVAVATFANNQGLNKIGDTMYIQSGNSGEATIGTAMSGSRGKVTSGALEQSNVDLSEEFVNMIVTQRGFQANSRVVTTSDEMLQELLSLKR